MNVSWFIAKQPLIVVVPALESSHPAYPIVEVIKRSIKEILRHPGKEVLIHETGVIGYFDSYKEAIEVGYERFGLDQFWVKKVDSFVSPIPRQYGFARFCRWIKNALRIPQKVEFMPVHICGL